MIPRVPHLEVVVFFCVVAVAFYAGFSVYVVAYTSDDALRGDIIGTWKSFATAAFFFWVGASSGGKTRDASQVPDPSATTTTFMATTSAPPKPDDTLDLTGAELPPKGEAT